MNSRRLSIAFLVAVALAGSLAAVFSEEKIQDRAGLLKAHGQGNYKDAYDGLRVRLLAAAGTPDEAAHELQIASDCLRQLGRVDELDAFLEEVATARASSWRMLWAVAHQYQYTEHYGFLVAGKFTRGTRRGEGVYLRSNERDRARALQLLTAAHGMLKPDEAGAVGQFYIFFGQVLMNDRESAQSWRLQALTDLATLPDYEEGWHGGHEPRGAPVDREGNPIFYGVPESYAAAKSDGERWRRVLAEAIERDGNLRRDTLGQRAAFLRAQFGVETLRWYPAFFSEGDDDAGSDNNNKENDDAADKKTDPAATSPYALHTLAETETIARLANGVRRFTLPDEHNPIRVLQELVAASVEPSTCAEALAQLADVFENRRQYPKAADYLKQAAGFASGDRRKGLEAERAQIIGNWGRFEPVTSQPAGGAATVEYRYRNGKSVAFTAHAIKIDELLRGVIEYLKSKPRKLDWNRVQIHDFGHRLVVENEKDYLGEEVAAWDLALDPLPDHFDRRLTVTTPLEKAGAYLVKARMEDGNESHVILWLDDMALIQKQFADSTYYFVADGITGAPVAQANVEFFGYRQRHVDGNRFELDIQHFAEHSGPTGEIVNKSSRQEHGLQWLAIARTAEGRLAFLGFDNVWYPGPSEDRYDTMTTFLITDRPVYRPGQPVHLKGWLRQARFGEIDERAVRGQTIVLELHDPRGESVLKTEARTDEYGGFELDYTLPADAMLGAYSIATQWNGSGFRVEEYKKPEFEVTIDAPKEPIALGEAFEAKVRARYYYGEPVKEASLKVKVLRTPVEARWYPWSRWDWLYGNGYWWYFYDCGWYPGWREWGCRRPYPWWWGGRSTPPELVAEVEGPIGPDGTLAVPIDTALAKSLDGSRDHRYSIVAEVTDHSRRTITGTGVVTAAASPFRVYVWTDRGYARAGDTVTAHFSARTPDGKPVTARGEAVLYSIVYDAQGTPTETRAGAWPVETDADGSGRVQITAADAGQYRMSVTLADDKERRREGAVLFNVIGTAFSGNEFTFNHLELIPDRSEYKPGEKVELMVNTNRSASTVLLFVRPVNGIYSAPRVLRLAGKSTVEDIAIAAADMPNFFVEAITVADGKLHSEVRQIVVPPEERVLEVEVLTSQKEYLPGAEATIDIRLTDASGEPFAGTTVVSVYDRALEYISGGSNVPEIRQFFWSWRRHHYPRTVANLGRTFWNLVKQNDPGMGDLGVFGDIAENERRRDQGSKSKKLGRGRAAGGERSELAAGTAAAPASEAKLEDGFLSLDEEAEGGEAFDDDAGGAGPALVAAAVRKDFADSALWVGRLDTDAQGHAQAKLRMPENLTAWTVKTWALGTGTRVGSGETEVVTRKNLILRLQAPRFFTQKDEVVLTANVHNYLAEAKRVQVSLELEGGALAAPDETTRWVEIAAGAEARVDWRVRAVETGEAIVRMKALSDAESDAMEMRFPVYVHGMLKMDSISGVVRPDAESAAFTLRVPEERRINDSRLEVRYSPTLAGAMVDALPYLLDYPYGCTEQTLNRFLPAAITQKVLMDMGLDLAAIRDKRTNLNSQETGDDRERATGWQQFKREPVFDRELMLEMVKKGLDRLTEMQLSDGGWGWFSGWGEHSSAHTTATVVHGLQIAQQNDVALVPGVLERGIEWLKVYQAEQVRELKNAPSKTKPWRDQAYDMDVFVFMVLVDADFLDRDMLEFLYRDRTHLSVYTQAMLGLALHKIGDAEKLAMVRRNVEQFIVQDDENQTAYLRMPEGYWWYWYGSHFEAHAYALKLLAAVDPKGETASRLAKYLLTNRKHATYWESTRDTALCIEALADYMRASGEDKPDMTVELWLDGKKVKEERITGENLFTFDNRLVLVGDAVESGERRVEVRRSGRGPVYFNAYLTNFTLEDDIPRAGLELKVERKFYKLIRDDKTDVVAGPRGELEGERRERYKREEIASGALLKSGDLLEVELEIDSKNDYEYLVFEDLKGAGFEPVEVRSGYTNDGMGAYVEFRDRTVSFFVRALAHGKHSVSYRLRAEIPGRFSALPAIGYAMYAPELRGNSTELKVSIED